MSIIQYANSIIYIKKHATNAIKCSPLIRRLPIYNNKCSKHLLFQFFYNYVN